MRISVVEGKIHHPRKVDASGGVEGIQRGIGSLESFEARMRGAVKRLRPIIEIRKRVGSVRQIAIEDVMVAGREIECPCSRN